ncbi:LOW QUALITY PROTEIN: cholinesterase 1-like [Haliotis rubra]|uniref:LOW QUALITY PROTEIN: cholinesterase 1-like n=1 Tax=Haliotis rubra TaxID=36100 RepID=UPI001EE5D2ED|nr:LOW QUALITY PROTEIN: cholinesterase 1-like [Haliotis rubra]
MPDITGVTASMCTPQCSVHSTTVESGTRMWIGMRLALATLLTLLLVLPTVKSQKVSTLNGPLLGQQLSVLGKSLDVFYGIPYAKPPVGDLRFKYPQPSESWGPEVRDAQNPTPSCFQPIGAHNTDEKHKQMPDDYSEDCLHLTVWAPSDNSGNLAVMVWIHGGGFYFGSTRLPLYEGKYIAAENGVIVVSINYRLGPLGFSYLGPDTIPGNMGLMDQRLALQWVKDNVANFGGDPTRVTIFGESAGGVCVGLHLVSPLSRDLFDRAITQSGTLTCSWTYMAPKTAKGKLKRFADLLECPSSSTDTEIYDCLKTADAQTMADLQLVLLDEGTTFPPVVDGYFVDDDPKSLLSTGSIKQTSVLHGFTKDETTLFSAMTLKRSLRNVSTLPEALILSRQEYDSFLSFDIVTGKDIGESIRLFYESQIPLLKDTDYFDVVTRATSDRKFKCPHLEFDRLYSPANPTYVYSFNRRLSVSPNPQWMGAPHWYELDFVFGWVLDKSLGCTEEEMELSRTIMTYWTNFAKSGNPNAPVPIKVNWPASDNTNLSYMALDVGSKLAAGHGVVHHECVFINRILPMISKDPPEGQEYCTKG